MGTDELAAIRARLEKLEKENRRIKGAGLVVLLLVSVLGLMGQAPGNRTVEAQRFVLKDSTGKIRASLDTTSENAMLVLYGPQGGKKSGFMAEIGAGPNGPFVFLDNGKNGGEPGAEHISLADLNGQPKLTLLDGEGFETSIGRTDLVLPRTGVTQNTSAASIVLFGKDKKVLWSAP